MPRSAATRFGGDAVAAAHAATAGTSHTHTDRGASSAVIPDSLAGASRIMLQLEVRDEALTSGRRGIPPSDRRWQCGAVRTGSGTGEAETEAGRQEQETGQGGPTAGTAAACATRAAARDEYKRRLDEQVRVAQQQAAQLQEQKRLAQARAQEEYAATLRQQQQRLQTPRDYAHDPYVTTPHTYVYVIGGNRRQTNQYGADVLRQAVKEGYRRAIAPARPTARIAGGRHTRLPSDTGTRTTATTEGTSTSPTTTTISVRASAGGTTTDTTVDTDRGGAERNPRHSGRPADHHPRAQGDAVTVVALFDGTVPRIDC